MPNVSVRIDDERREKLDALADNAGLSRAAYIRDALDIREEYDELRQEHGELRGDYEQLQSEYEALQEEYTELHEELDEYEDRIEDLERENERLRREKRLVLEQREEHTDLVKTVERQQSLAERKASAGVLTRAKWWLVGMADEE